MRVVDAGDQDLSGTWPDPGDGHEASDSRIRFSNCLQLFGDSVELFRQRVQDCQLDVEFAFPKFVVSAFGQRLAEGVNVFTSRVLGFVAHVDRDSLVDEPGSDRIFRFVDASIKRLTILDQ